MKPGKLTVYQLFEVQRRYRVPLYQRPYVWDEEGHWEPLWEDILRQVTCVMEGSKQRPHFLGAVVLNHIKPRSRGVPPTEIIDGQQRLTTLQIFLSAFRDITSSYGFVRLLDELVTLTFNRRLSDDEDYENTLKLLPTKADQETYKKIAQAGSPEQLGEKITDSDGTRLAKAYLFFYKQIEEYVTEDNVDESEIEKRLWWLYDAIHDLLHLIAIDLEENDDPQIIFETLNARGVPLLPSDLIRNFVLQSARDANENMDELYVLYWKEFDERRAETAKNGEDRYWKIPQRQGRFERPLLDLFFFHYLQYKSRHEFSITRLYQEFRNWWNDEAEGTTAERLSDIREHATLFASFYKPDLSTRSGLFMQRLQTLDTSTLYPVLLHVLGPLGSHLDDSEKVSILEALESYLVRRLLSRLTAKNYNKFFFSLLRVLHKAERATPALVLNHLLSSDEETARWPKDDEIRTKWLHDSAYGKIRGDRVQMVLLGIESQVHTSRQERLEMSSSLTLEHVMPVKWLANWPLDGDPNTVVGEHGETIEGRRNRLLHTFGNLTLLTQPLNSKVSNGPYTTKKPEITRQSTLLLNAYFQDHEVWDEEAILQRGRVLCDVALQAWKRPKST